MGMKGREGDEKGRGAGHVDATRRRGDDVAAVEDERGEARGGAGVRGQR